MITEKELIIAAKTFRANCIANGDKMPFPDACKIVLLAEIAGCGVANMSPEELAWVCRKIIIARPWWKFW
jgi:hypothetical protein